MQSKIRIIYLYIFSLIGLVLITVGGVRLVNVALKIYIFPQADTNVFLRPPAPISEKEAKINSEAQKKIRDAEKKSRRQSDMAEALALIIVGLPLYVYHWKTIQNNRRT